MVTLDPSKRKSPVKKVAITPKEEDTISSSTTSDKLPQQQVSVRCMFVCVCACMCTRVCGV